MAGTATITINQSNQITELGIEPSQHEINAFRSSGVGVVRNLISQAEVESVLSVVMDAAARRTCSRCQRDCSVVSMDAAREWQRR